MIREYGVFAFVFPGDRLLLIVAVAVVLVVAVGVSWVFVRLGHWKERKMTEHRTDLEQLQGILGQFSSEIILEAVRSLNLLPEPVEEKRIVRIEQQLDNLKARVVVTKIDEDESGTGRDSESAAIPSLDNSLLNASRRGAEIIALMQDWVTLVQDGEHLQIRIEPITPGLETLSEGEILMIRERFHLVNTAIRNGDIVVTPGLSSVSIVNKKQALDALAPGLFSPWAMEEWIGGSSTTPLATVDGQWFPPGITIELTRRETDDLIDILLLGSLAALTSILETWGVSAKVALPIAIALLALAGMVKLCKELSATGQVGFKITVIPTMVTPYPV